MPAATARTARNPLWVGVRRALFLVHRWLGIITCLLCVMWFLSGLVMLYVPFPAWRDAERLATLPPIDAGTIALTPDEAVAASGLDATGLGVRLEMWGAEPVYRLQRDGKLATVSAVDARVIGPVAAGQAEVRLKAMFAGQPVVSVGEVQRDQWTVTKKFDTHRPLHLFTVGDGMSVYVSSRTGEIVQNAMARERFWNWLGAIPHWIYFTPIRADQELWRQVVMWVSGSVVIGAVLGLWVGILRLRPSNWRTGQRVTPFRGWMKWHHVGGLVGGLFLVTWIFSGWLSVNPFHVFTRPQLTPEQEARYAAAGPRFGVRIEALKATLTMPASELKLAWLAGRPLLIARGHGERRVADARTGRVVTLSEAELLRAVRPVFLHRTIAGHEWLTEEDAYWRSHHSQRVLPVLRVKFDDAAHTWLTIDAVTGEVAGVTDDNDRRERWLFDFLHKFDLPALMQGRPWRDVLIWLLSCAGLIIAGSGVVIGWRHLKRATPGR